MKTFEVIIPSHTDAPDFETTIDAETKQEAAEILAAKFAHEGEEWGTEELLKYISE